MSSYKVHQKGPSALLARFVVLSEIHVGASNGLTSNMEITLPSRVISNNTVQPARNLHLNTRHRDLPQRVRWKWPPRSVFFADISGGHQCSMAHGSEHRATRCTNTADPDGRTRRSLILYNLHVQCRQWKTVDRDDPSRATTANPRVRSSRYARVMITRVNGCSAAVFDRAWIIQTTGVRGFMKVPRWLYCINVWTYLQND